MVTGELKAQVDAIWNSFWSGGIANPIEVIEQLTFLLFIRRLDDLQTLEENFANQTGEPMRRVIFPEGDDERGRPYEDLRWSRFKRIRQLVGLDRAAAKEAFAEFLDAKRFGANQIEFVNLVIDELVEAGVIEARRFYESPFTDVTPHGPDALFEPDQVDRLLATVRDVRSRAEAA